MTQCQAVFVTFAETFASMFSYITDRRRDGAADRLRSAVMSLLVAGDKEQEDGTVAVRARKEGDKGTMSVSDFVALIREHIDNKIID